MMIWRDEVVSQRDHSFDAFEKVGKKIVDKQIIFCYTITISIVEARTNDKGAGDG
jgi:hypothetical protein